MPADTLERHVKWADGFLLMYSVTDRPSLEEARRLKEVVYTHRHAEIPMVLVANKSDLLTARAVTEDEGERSVHVVMMIMMMIMMMMMMIMIIMMMRRRRRTPRRQR